MRQRTLKSTYTFEGKGLHTGRVSRITLSPSAEDTGLSFVRSDFGGAIIPAKATCVTSTARSTTIGLGEAEVHTIEHIMSTLTGLGVDNALLTIDGVEVPILDGSARPFCEAILRDGLVEQEAQRRYIELKSAIEIKDEKSGSWVRVEPADSPSIDITVDFNSKVLGVQTAHWDETVDYFKEIGVCRTFVFFHEIEFLFANNLIKGGDVDNAIVIVEHPVSEEQLERMSASMGVPKLQITGDGYLNNLTLHYPNECARHKLLDLIGDLRLCGGFLKAKVTAFKPGHTINTSVAKAIISEN